MWLIYGYSNRSNFNTMYFWQNNSIRFYPYAYEPSGHRLLPPLTVPGMGSILLSKPYSQSECGLLCSISFVTLLRDCCCYLFQGSQLDEIDDYFSLLVACNFQIKLLITLTDIITF